MAFLRKKTIRKNGKIYYYTYWQQSVRQGKRVLSLHLGKVPPEKSGLRYIERQIAKYPGDPFAAKAAERQAVKDKVAKELGVTFAKDGETVTPIEKSGVEVAPQSHSIAGDTQSPDTSNSKG